MLTSMQVSSNYWKNSIGMNKAIIDNDVLGTKKLHKKPNSQSLQKHKTMLNMQR